MNTQLSYIPLRWLLGQIDFKLFLPFEKTEENFVRHEISFVRLAEFKVDKSPTSLNRKGISFKQIKSDEFNDYAMIVRLAGRFNSLDEFEVKQITADLDSIRVLIDYIQVESQDGVPDRVAPYLIVPLNEMFRNKEVMIKFEAIKRDFLTGREEKDVTKSILDFYFSFECNNKK